MMRFGGANAQQRASLQQQQRKQSAVDDRGAAASEKLKLERWKGSLQVAKMTFWHAKTDACQHAASYHTYHQGDHTLYPH
jgi:hypothetical protein